MLTPNNVPLHNPVFPSSLEYGADDCKGISVLLEVPEKEIREILSYTPFEFVSAHAWIDLMVLDQPHVIDRFFGGGVIIPARYKDIVGGYYAHCYVDTDEALALGREPYGYPKKMVDGALHQIGKVTAASMRRKDAAMDLSLFFDGSSEPAPDVPSYPHLLVQTIASAESPDILLQRVVSRDTSAHSKMKLTPGVPGVVFPETTKPNELAWLREAKPVYGVFFQGAFGSAHGKVLDTLIVGDELKRADVAR